jgi:hypothetical protein
LNLSWSKLGKKSQSEPTFRFRYREVSQLSYKERLHGFILRRSGKTAYGLLTLLFKFEEA